MRRGYVKLWRKSLDSQSWANAELWKVWSWCMMKAAHKTHWVSIGTGRGSREVQINPGQFIFGRDSASRELKMKPSSVRNRMEKLKKLRNLDMQPDTHCTIVTLLQWKTYAGDETEGGQPTGQREDNGRTTVGQREDSGRTQTRMVNIKSTSSTERIDPKKATRKFTKPTLAEVTAYCLERKNGIDPQYFMDSNEAKGWVVGTTKTPMKVWKAVVRTWERNGYNKADDGPVQVTSLDGYAMPDREES